MRKLIVFNNVTLDGYFTDNDGDMSWAHKPDREFNSFIHNNAKKGGEFVFGRVTYEMMASFWPTSQAIEMNPIVAKKMNSQKKYVFSKKLKKAAWKNSKILKGDLTKEIKKLKSQKGPDLLIFGSGKLVAQLASLGLIDEYQFVLNPLALGSGRTMFEGIKERLSLKLKSSRVFKNGNLFLRYVPE